MMGHKLPPCFRYRNSGANLRGTASNCMLLVVAGAVESKACVHSLAMIESTEDKLLQGVGNMLLYLKRKLFHGSSFQRQPGRRTVTDYPPCSESQSQATGGIDADHRRVSGW
jgi:hypothetical protein